MHGHLHGDCTSAALFHSVLYTNNGSSVTERTMKINFLGPLVTLEAQDPLTT